MIRGLGHGLARTGRRGRLLVCLAVVMPLGALGALVAAGPAVAGLPSTATTLSVPSTGTVGTPVNANAISATLSGAATTATGDISFIVFGPVSPGSPPPPPSCNFGTSLGTVTVSGYHTYYASKGWTPESAGVYWYAACYTGDGQNNGSGSSTTSVISDHLVITPPANITTDATGPSGARVTYPAPVVTDAGNPSPPAATCSPPSGSVFPIGTTTVHCSASDPKASPSMVTTTFTVTVKGAADQLADLYQSARNTRGGWALAGIVALAGHEVAAGHPLLACVTLDFFMIVVRAETPWLIPPGTAAQLIADARQIQAVLGCSGFYPFRP